MLLTNWLALLLKPNWVDLRTAMPATALLTAVFLQSSYSVNLPDLSYLVLMDKIYVLAYATFIATLALIIWSNQRMKGCEVDDLISVRRVDLIAALVQFVIFTGILIFLIIAG